MRHGQRIAGTVLVVSHEASNTGAPRVAVQTTEAFSAAGLSTTSVLRWGGPLRSEFHRVADRVIDEPAQKIRAALHRSRYAKRLVPNLGVWAARRVIRSTRPRLVWANTVVSAPYVMAAVELGVPVVLHAHEPRDLVRSVLDRTGLDRFVAEHAEAVTLVGCSTEAATVLASELGVSPETVTVIHSGVDVAAVRAAAGPAVPTAGAPVVLAVGLGNQGKGFDVFAAAAELAARQGLNARWRWVGEVVMDLDAHAVERAGPVANASSEIAASDVFVLPSRGDSFPLVVLEAMALGRPVVSSDLPGPREQLGDGGGLIVPVGDVEQLVDAVTVLINDPAVSARLGAAGSERCEALWDVSRFRQRVVETAQAVMC